MRRPNWSRAGTPTARNAGTWRMRPSSLLGSKLDRVGLRRVGCNPRVDGASVALVVGERGLHGFTGHVVVRRDSVHVAASRFPVAYESPHRHRVVDDKPRFFYLRLTRIGLDVPSDELVLVHSAHGLS